MKELSSPSPIPERKNVSSKEFLEEILPAGKPLVMRRLVADWPVVQNSQKGHGHLIKYLSSFDANKDVELVTAPPEREGRFFYNDDMTGLNFEKRATKISQALSDLEKQVDETNGTGPSRSIYLHSLQADEVMPGFSTDNPLEIDLPTVDPRVWIGGPLTVQTHYDLSENIACVVAGHRRFTIFPPDQIANLYPGPLEMTLAGPPVSMVRLEDPDLEKYPNFPDAMSHALTAELNPGDAIFIPYAWWHHIQSLSDVNTLVNFWWGREGAHGSPYEALLHTILTVRDLNPRHRDVWQTIFNHYTFGASEDPTGHLPPHIRGGLGPHDEELRKRCWGMLANATMKYARFINGLKP